METNSTLQPGWKVTHIGELATFRNGSAFNENHWRACGLPIIRIQNLNGSAEFNHFDGDPANHVVINPGDLLFSWSGNRGTSFGPFVWNGPRGVLNQHIFKVKPAEGIDHQFLLQALREVTKAIEKQAHGGTGIVHVRKSELQKFKVLLPPAEYRRVISNILWAIDDAIEATRAVIEQTRRLKSALLQELLTKGLPGEKHRFKSDRHFGTFPISWSTKKLSQVVPDNRPITYGIVQAGPDIPGGVPYIRVSDMQGRQLETCGMLRTSPEIANNYRRSRVHPGDVVFALRGDVGAVHIVPQELEGANLTQGTARISPGPLVDGRFLLWALRSPSCVDAIHKRIKGSTFKEISLTDLADVPIAVPSLNEQQRIRDVLDAVEHRIWSDEDHCDELLQLKSALSQGLLMGRIPVKGGR